MASVLAQYVTAKQEEMSNDIEFMHGRTKGETIVGTLYTIKDYAFIKGKKGEYAVFITEEDKEHFFNGGKAITDMMKLVEEANLHGDLKEEGIPFVSHGKITTNNGNSFTKVTFYPSAETLNMKSNDLPF